MNAEELNGAFIDACNQCPQFDGFDEDQQELVNGRYVNVAALHKKGAVAVLRYWFNRDTIGGNLIHNMGYEAFLPTEVLSFLARVDAEIDAALSRALETFE